MDLKPFTVPHYIDQLDAYYRRLIPCDCRTKLGSKLNNYWTGYKGEKATADMLSRLSRDFLTIHDLRLSNGMFHFQIDTLVLHTNFILVLETKNITGLLEIDPQDQRLNRTATQKQDKFENPVIQLITHQEQLQDWLVDHHPAVPGFPIDGFVVNAAPAGHYHNLPPDQAEKIVRRAWILQRIHQLSKQYPNQIISRQQLLRLAHQLIESHKPKKIDLIAEGIITPDQIRKGVECPHCGHMPMKRLKRKWHCPACGCTSTNAHIKTFRDFSLMNKKTITNSECREILMIESETIARNILISMNLRSEGSNKNRFYYMPMLI